VNLEVMRTNPLAIDPVAWERMGYVVDVNYLDRSATTILAGGSGE
jgi:hypothetical protein